MSDRRTPTRNTRAAPPPFPPQSSSGVARTWSIPRDDLPWVESRDATRARAADAEPSMVRDERQRHITHTGRWRRTRLPTSSCVPASQSMTATAAPRGAVVTKPSGCLQPTWFCFDGTPLSCARAPTFSGADAPHVLSEARDHTHLAARFLFRITCLSDRLLPRVRTHLAA